MGLHSAPRRALTLAIPRPLLLLPSRLYSHVFRKSLQSGAAHVRSHFRISVDETSHLDVIVRLPLAISYVQNYETIALEVASML